MVYLLHIDQNYHYFVRQWPDIKQPQGSICLNMKVMPGLDSLSSPNGLHEAPLSTRPIVNETGPDLAGLCVTAGRRCGPAITSYLDTSQPDPGRGHLV